MTASNRKLSKRHIRQAIAAIEAWFESMGRRPFRFQRETWQHYLNGNDGLVHSHTGTGKTLAAFLGPVIETLALNASCLVPAPSTSKTRASDGLKASTLNNKKVSEKPGAVTVQTKKPPRSKNRTSSSLQVLWITPLRALASDTEANLQEVLTALNVPWLVEKRTSDSKASVRARQRVSLPHVLITTPESVTLQLTREENVQRFSQLRLVVVDEWHELMGTKRGVQTELALARLRTLQPNLRIWGLSATIGNLTQALDTLVGLPSTDGTSPPKVLVQGRARKALKIDVLIPSEIERFPWAGHLGHKMTGQVANTVRQARSTLIFTNTRSQAEYWYQALLSQLPELAGLMAVHHGSLDQTVRWWIEERLRDGRMRCCVCTSSLELGVDFPEVDRVIQIGSPKGCARLIQRAGRSGHQPDAQSCVTFVPTHALELVEIAALQQAIKHGHIEQRIPLSCPLDVLAQHVVTIALGSGFEAQQLLSEVRRTTAYANLSDQQWQWVIDFAEHGGASLGAYPDYHRITLDNGVYRVTDRRIATMHRMSIGTIVSDSAVQVRYQSGKALGSVEESFIGRLESGDRFMLGGKLLELVRLHDNTAWVKRGRGEVTAYPRWMGGRMPLSSELSQALREQLEHCHAGEYIGPAMQAVQPLMELQKAWSTIASRGELLIERWHSREGYHLFVYPFEGRLVHEGLASLWALRLSRLEPISFAMAMNDYGFLLVSPTEAPLAQALDAGLLSTSNVSEDILASLNATEMSKRQFREVARIAGLIFQGYPGNRKLTKHLQASSNMFYDVFVTYDPGNLLLAQARNEVLERQLEITRLMSATERLSQSAIRLNNLPRPSPLSFPLLADRLRDKLSSENFAQRVERMLAKLNEAAAQTT